MSVSQLGIVMIHGINSSPKVWQRLQKLIANDEELKFVQTLPFGYATGLKRIHPLRVFPSIDTIADSLKEFLATEAGGFERLMLVTHSQGGLVAQRYLARMLADGEGRKLARIRLMIMLACPNNGSELLLSLRRNVFGLSHPQERDLRPINDQVTATLRTVLRDVVQATNISERTCPIEINVYSGESDRVVSAASAQSIFPKSAALPGDHSTILKANSVEHRTFTTPRRLIISTPTDVALPGAQQSSEQCTVTNIITGGTSYGPVIQGGSVEFLSSTQPRGDEES